MYFDKTIASLKKEQKNSAQEPDVWWKATRVMASKTLRKAWGDREKQQLEKCLPCKQEDPPNSWNLHKKARHGSAHICNLSTGEAKTGEFLEFIGQTA